METLILLPDQPCAVNDQLEITLLFITEEWSDSERRAEVHITIKIKTPHFEEEIEISTENPHFVWRDYAIEYQGGWLKGIQLGVKQAEKIN